jgi:predicted ATPase
MRDLATFRARVQELYRRARVYDDRRPTQKDLASAIGLNYFELSNRLNHTKGAQLSQRDIRAIIRTLADWGAISTQAEALELLDLLNCPSFTEAEWQTPPLSALTPLDSSPPPRPALAAPASAMPPHNLPEELTSFVEREDVAAITQLLGAQRLVTITGTGGIGKTRVALRAAAAVLPTYPEGAWLVELAPLSDGCLVVPTVMATLGLREHGDRNLLTTLITYLKTKRLLLILDNCEHLLDACAHLTVALLAACPQLTILATSREPLSSMGETTWPLAPLRPPADAATLAELQRNPAVRLLIDRATAALPHFALTSENAPSIVDLCQRLDGIPLAIELAAARMRGLSVEQIAARLDDRFRLLNYGSRTALPRQQTLRALVDWSYALLTSDEQILLARLAVFLGGWDMAAAEAVAADERGSGRLGETDVLDGVLQLVNKSLVIVDQHPGESRYSMLETIRQYALEKLPPADEREVRRRHARYFLDLCIAGSNGLRGADQAVWLARLATEYDNVRSMLDWTLAHEPAHALQATASLWLFWYMRGYLGEGRLRQAQALAADEGKNESLQAQVLNGAGALAWAQGDYEAAQASYQQCLAIRRRLGERWAMAGTLHNLGILLMDQADFEAARALFHESRAIYEEAGDAVRFAISLTSIANLAAIQGDYDTAWILNQQALMIDRGLQDQQNIAVSLNNLGELALLQGDYLTAEQLLREGLDIRQRLGDPARVASSLGYLGRLALIQGDYGSALTHLRQSLTLRQELGERRGQALALTTLAERSLAMAEYEAARDHYREALTILLQLDDRNAGAAALEGCGWLATAVGDMHHATRLLGASAALRRSLGTPLPHWEQKLHREALATLRAALAPAVLDRLWAEGEQLTFAQAVDEALLRGQQALQR